MADWILLQLTVYCREFVHFMLPLLSISILSMLCVYVSDQFMLILRIHPCTHIINPRFFYFVFLLETLKFMPKPVDRKLELGSTSKIHCKAHGASPLKIRWVKVFTKHMYTAANNSSLLFLFSCRYFHQKRL